MEDEKGAESIAMKKELYEYHAEFCKTFTSPKRLEIMDLLKSGEMTVTDIQKKIGVTRAHTSVLLSVMRLKKILKTRRDRTNIYYSIANKNVGQACNAMQKALARLMVGVASARSLRERR
jgi:ArsR family transcriptional regulator